MFNRKPKMFHTAKAQKPVHKVGISRFIGVNARTDVATRTENGWRRMATDNTERYGRRDDGTRTEAINRQLLPIFSRSSGMIPSFYAHYPVWSRATKMSRFVTVSLADIIIRFIRHFACHAHVEFIYSLYFVMNSIYFFVFFFVLFFAVYLIGIIVVVSVFFRRVDEITIIYDYRFTRPIRIKSRYRDVSNQRNLFHIIYYVNFIY